MNLENKKCFAIDFDNTLVIGDNYPAIGEPNWPVVNKVKELQKEGHEICLWTCRVGKRLQEAVDFCNNVLGIKIDSVQANMNELALYWTDTPCKIVADYYIDDKALSINDFINLTDYNEGKSIRSIINNAKKGS